MNESSLVYTEKQPNAARRTGNIFEQAKSLAMKQAEVQNRVQADRMQRGYEALAAGWQDTNEGSDINARRRKSAVDAFGEDYVSMFEAAPVPEQKRALAERFLTDYYTKPGDESFRPALRYCEQKGVDPNADVYSDIHQRFLDAGAVRYQEEKRIENMREEEMQWIERYLAGEEEMSAEHSDAVLSLFGNEMVKRIAKVRSVAELIDEDVSQKEGSSKRIAPIHWEDPVYSAIVDPETGEIDEASRMMMSIALHGIAKRVQESDRGVWAFDAALTSLSTSYRQFLVNLLREDSADYQRLSDEVDELERLANDEAYYRSKRMTQERRTELMNAHTREAAIELRYGAPLYDPEERKNIAEKRLPEARRKLQEVTSRKIVRGMLQDYVKLADSSPEGTSWYKKTLKGVGDFTGSTVPYLVPYVGPVVGTATNLVSSSDYNLNANLEAGLTPEASLNRAKQDALISSSVELLPWSRVGGLGFNATIGRGLKYAGYKPGAFSSMIAEFASRGTAHAALTETVAGVIDEGVLEPLAQGLLTMSTDAAMDALGVDHGVSRSYSEAFAELKEVWTDPTQLTALVLFSGALTGARLPQMHAQSKEFAAFMREASQQAGVWQAMGLSDGDVRRVMQSENPLQTGSELFNAALERDPEGLKRRMAKQGARLQEEGFSLRLTGTTGELSADTEAALAEAYREMVDERVMPQVERIADKDGQMMFRLTERDRHTNEVVSEQELSGAQADTYLQLRMAQVDARRLRLNQQTVYEDMAQHVEQLAGAALTQQAEELGAAEGLTMQNMNELPEGVGEAVQQAGFLSFRVMKLAAAKLGGQWKHMVEAFQKRAQISGRDAEMSGTAAFRAGRSAQPLSLGEKTVFGSMISYAQGNVTPLEMLEESVETRADMWLQLRAQELADVSEDADEAQRQALGELADVVRRARAELLKMEPSLKISEVPEHASYMEVIEAMSDMGRARLLTSPVMPAWMNEVQDIVSSALDETAEAIRIADAAKRASTQDMPGWKQLEDIFASFDLPMGNVYSAARIDAAVIEQVRCARARVRGTAVATTAAEVMERQAEDAARDAEIERRQEAYEESEEPQASTHEEGKPAAEQVADTLAQQPEAMAPSGMKGVFVRDACVYNEAGGFYIGCVPVRNLRDSKEIEQVKAGDKGAHGVVNPITGEYQQETEAIYVWRRRDGALEVISGRHKYALALENGTESVICYVFNEDAQHDAKWARLLDFENNMRGDQADELTSAIYTRETGYDDATLRRKGLMRNKSKSKRGILIGREARAELWDRFVNGAVSPMDAEIICTMTQGVRDKKRVDEIQRRCCMLLDQGKSWEYISAMVQLMANKESVFMKQGLLDLGVDFEADMARAAAYVEDCVKKLTEAINVIKSGRRLSGEKRKLAERLGQFTTSTEASETLFRDLTDMRERFRNIGAYPDLVAAASMWDGKTELDPVEMARNYAHSELEQAAEEANMTREQWEEAQAAKAAQQAAQEATGSLFISTFSLLHKLDDAYMDALRRGDEETAHKLVLEAAKASGYIADSDYQGSLAFNGRAPEENGYFETEQERHNAWKNGEFEGTITLNDFVRNGIDPTNLKWQISDEGAYIRAEDYTRESIDAIRAAKASRSNTITIYRAVPKSVKEKSARNGDWVTLSEAYAKLHITLQDWDGARIIKQTVSMDHVWWDGNDINEWGYDDGKEYAYRNTANNRKSLATVTYDANRNIIPLSQRFNPRKSSVSFSLTGKLTGKTGHASFSHVDVPANGVVKTAKEAREILKPLQGRVFTNKNTGISAIIQARLSRQTIGKVGASQMSVSNLKPFGYSREQAQQIHHTAAVHIHELFENAEDAFLEEAYKEEGDRAGVYHFFNTIHIEGVGSFDVNVMAVKQKRKEQGNFLYALELTIENPQGYDSESGLRKQVSTIHASRAPKRKLASYRSFVEKEMRGIKEKSQEEGTFMKAPNGKPTNLTERQWLTVRTQAFKNWFGDWENAPEDASKVVDENGEPKVVYHNSGKRRNVLSREFSRKSMDIESVCFAPESDPYGEYGPYEHAVFLRILTPADYDTAYTEHGIKLAVTDDAGVKIREWLQDRGYDGVIEEEDGAPFEYKVFESTQIKSATDNRGTFDPASPDITFSMVPPREAQRIAREFNALEKSEGIRISAPGVYVKDTKAAAAYAKERYNALKAEVEGGKPLLMPIAGEQKEIQLPGRGFNEVKHHAADRRNLACLCGLRDLCESAIYINSASDSKQEKPAFKAVVAYHYFAAKGNFEGASAYNADNSDEAYVSIVIAERSNGEFFYDLNATNVEVIDNDKNTSEELPSNRVTNSAMAAPGGVRKGRIHLTKEFVNYVNAKNAVSGSFSLRGTKLSARELKRIDAQYQEAVKAGDLTQAAELVAQYAAAKGYVIDDGEWKMMHRAPDRQSGESLENMAEGSDLVPADYWEHPEWYQTEAVQRAAFYKVKDFLDRAKAWKRGERKEPVMRFYRAVPKDVRESYFRNGDWITPEKEYAQEHGLRQFGAGKYRVIIDAVKASDAWWNADDICEWGYDDGKNYAYQNTSRNRKLLDVITYDPEGNPIPLSKRFNKMHPSVSFSIRDMSQAARVMLRRREDDLEGEELIARWDELLERLETASVDSHDGAARLGVLVALLESTRSVLPPQYAKLGRLHALMKWAAVYAHMVSTGEVKRDGVLKGVIFEKFAAAMQREYEGSLQRGLSEEEAREVLQELGERKLEDALMKVAKECRARLDVFVKARARERIRLTAQRAYPKKEKGRKSPRGKMEAAHYRAMSTMLAWMDASAEKVAERMQQLRASIEQMESADDNQQDGASRAELEEELRIVQLYGDWSGMSAAQARRAAEDFVQFVLTNRHSWDARLEEERRRREWSRLRMRFSTPSNSNTRSKTKREGGLLLSAGRSLRAFVMNSMSYSQMMLAGRRVFGEAFTRARLQEIADANAALRNARRERDDVFAMSLMEATGKKRESELVKWLNRFGRVEKKTGIFKREVSRHTLEMSRDEAEAWCSMTPQQRAARRRELYAEAEASGLAPVSVPTESDVEKLAEELAAMEERNSKAQKVRVKVPRYGEKIELEASRDAVANAILLLEQEDYQHLIEYEGFTPRDKDGKEINRDLDPDTPLDVEQTLKPLYDFIGEDGRAFAYALRRYVGQNGKRMQAVYEAQQGVPLAMKPNYWRGNFNLNTIKEKDTLTENNGSVGGGGGYGFLIDRVRHYNRLEWTNTATMVFGTTVETQNNYTYTSGITREWRALLTDTDFQKRLEVELGRPYMTALKEWLDIIDGVRRSSPAMAWLGRLQQRLSRGLAFSALAGNGFVLAKQGSAILHGLLGGEVPRGVVERGDGVRELTWRKIGLVEYAAAMVRTKAGLGAISLRELASCEWFKARTDSRYKNLARRMSMSEDKKQHAFSNKLADKTMDVIEWVDRGANLIGMQALADAVYRDVSRINREKELGMSESEIKREALAAVGRALSISAQPHEASEKSLFGARGGIISNMLFQFKSETINKMGLVFSRMLSGEASVGLRDYMIFGVANAAIAAAIAWIRYGDDDDKKKDNEWKAYVSFVLNALTGDLSAVPLLGDEIRRGTSMLTGDYYRQRGILEGYFDVGGMRRHVQRLAKGEKSRKPMDWHDYVVEVNGLVRKLGVLSSFLGDGATWSELVLSAAAASNVVRTGADVANGLNGN